MTIDEVAKLKIGDIRYECYSGSNREFRVTSEPVVTTEHIIDEDRKCVAFDAVNTVDDEPIKYSLMEGLEHYGPRIYRDPQYITSKDGEMKFFLCDRYGKAQKEWVRDGKNG